MFSWGFFVVVGFLFFWVFFFFLVWADIANVFLTFLGEKPSYTNRCWIRSYFSDFLVELFLNVKNVLRGKVAVSEMMGGGPAGDGGGASARGRKRGPYEIMRERAGPVVRLGGCAPCPSARPSRPSVPPAPALQHLGTTALSKHWALKPARDCLWLGTLGRTLNIISTELFRAVSYSHDSPSSRSL